MGRSRRRNVATGHCRGAQRARHPDRGRGRWHHTQVRRLPQPSVARYCAIVVVKPLRRASKLTIRSRATWNQARAARRPRTRHDFTTAVRTAGVGAPFRTTHDTRALRSGRRACAKSFGPRWANPPIAGFFDALPRSAGTCSNDAINKNLN
jgi:hypothetical protein